MSGQPGESLIELLYDVNPDVNRIIGTFVARFNAVYGNPAAVRWDISKEEWQRYEFLGDRVLDLIIAQSLFTRREGTLDEGEMTRILGSVVSNRTLDLLSKKYDPEIFSRLIPLSIGEQETYGERITGGAFEALIGALYCEVGLDDVTFFVLAVMTDIIDEYQSPRECHRAPAGIFPETGRMPAGLPGDIPERPGPPAVFHRQGPNCGWQDLRGVGKNPHGCPQGCSTKSAG